MAEIAVRTHKKIGGASKNRERNRVTDEYFKWVTRGGTGELAYALTRLKEP